jgi:hypothetical protein
MYQAIQFVKQLIRIVVGVGLVQFPGDLYFDPAGIQGA